MSFEISLSHTMLGKSGGGVVLCVPFGVGYFRGATGRAGYWLVVVG